MEDYEDVVLPCTSTIVDDDAMTIGPLKLLSGGRQILAPLRSSLEAL